MSKFILSVDQGTTGTTALLINSDNFQLVDKVDQDHTQYYPAPGWVEHDLDEIWKSVETVVRNLLDKNNVRPQDLLCMGITNQRETTCAFDDRGNPLARAIVWQDRRTSEDCEKIRKQNLAEAIQATTGLPVDPYFSATKMQWLLQHVDKVKQAGKKGHLRLGTIDTFLLYRLTNGHSFKTDATNASRTMLMNLRTAQWSEEFLELFGIKKSFLPTIEDTFSHFGVTEGLSFLPDGLPITGIVGDQQSALLGQGISKRGGLKCTYGTGAFLLLNTGTELAVSKNGILSTIAFKDRGQIAFALEGNSYIAGAAVQWLRDNLNIFEKSEDVEGLALEVQNLQEMENILFLPYFSGIGSPHWRPDAKAAIIGLSRDTNRHHLARACLEGIALSIQDLIMALERDGQIKISELNVDGGAVANDLLMQIQANYSDIHILRPSVIETTGYGAALAAAIGIERMSVTDLDKFTKIERRFIPIKNDGPYYMKKRQQWNKAVRQLYLG